ncbi:MAG TPA: hypothetical protein VJ904_04650 [Tichowtungia sp.]|nr:hypothetical protein [Tichowtungia sp.]
MNRFFLVCIGIALAAGGCAASEPEEKTLTLVNAAAVDGKLLEQVRAFAQKELKVPVRLIDVPALAGNESFQALETAAAELKTERDVTCIVVAELPGAEHLRADPDTGIAIINAKALYTDDVEKFTGRIRRMVMRAAAFSFGMEPTPDPYCVTRDYRSLEDLDRMGNNYSPPWQARYTQEAKKRGLRIITPGRAQPPAMP